MDISAVKIGFIGFGSMAGAICEGLLKKDAVPAGNIYACARNQERLHAKCSNLGINALASAEEVASASDIVVIAVLPEQVEEAVRSAAQALKGKIIFSIAAGVSCSMYEEWLGEGYSHISTIPNTPVAVGEGIIAAESRHTLTDEQLALFEGVFSRIAKIEYFSPELLSLGGTGAGCTPAFVDVFIEALADGLVKHGMSRAQAYAIVPQMMKGTAEYMMQSGLHPGALKDAVCSPGGTTIVGISALEECGFRHAVIHAIDEIMEK